MPTTQRGSVQFIHGSQFTTANVQAALDIDRLYFTPENFATLERCLAWRNKNPEVYSGLLLNEELIGYLNLMPIETSSLPQILHPDFKDVEISANAIEPFDHPKEVVGYLASICVRDRHRGPVGQNSLIVDLLLEKLAGLEKRGFFFRTIWARATTPAGHRLFRRLEFQQQPLSDLYKFDFAPR